jgi:hypothetical protein
MLHAHLLICAWGLCTRGEGSRDRQCSGGGEKELVNSKNPHYPFIYLLGEGTWVATWQKEWKRQPTNGQRNKKITTLPMKRYALSKDDI